MRTAVILLATSIETTCVIICYARMIKNLNDSCPYYQILIVI